MVVLGCWLLRNALWLVRMARGMVWDDVVLKPWLRLGVFNGNYEASEVPRIRVDEALLEGIVQCDDVGSSDAERVRERGCGGDDVCEGSEVT
jgi:hypothetical protein